MSNKLLFGKTTGLMKEIRLTNGKWILLLFLFTFSILLCGTKSEAATLYWPVPGHTTLSQGYHEGKAIDISDGSIAGADVVAAMGGTVTNKFVCGTKHYGQNGDCNGFGTGLVIAGDDGRIYQYAHMQANSIPGNVYQGAYVSAGQQIGKVGTTGNSSGNHLHFGISIGKYWYESGINPANETYQVQTPHTHSYSASVTTQPTCTATGVRTYSCSCGSFYTESIPAKGHSYKNQVVAPTLTEKGYTLHTCSVCGNSYKDNYVNPPELKSDGWYYCATVPNGITSDKYTIEYENYYEKIQATSPGSDWTNVATVKNEWQNSGGQYTSETDLPTSDSRVLVRSVYYHFCGPNAGAAGNYELSGNFVHYDEIGAPSVIPTYCGVDNGHPYYVLDWIDGGGRVWCESGVTCDGSYGSHGGRCKAWYKMNTYQDRVKVVQYKFTKNSGWITTKDASATSVKVRFKSIVEESQPENPSEPEKEEPETPEPGKPEEPEKEEPETPEPGKPEEPETPEPEIPAAPENPDEPESGTSDDYHFSVNLSNGKLYFTWDAINPKAIYAVEYSIIPTAGFLEECFYDVVPAQDDKMCYVTNALPYRENWQIYFRLKIKCSYDDTNPVYSEVFEFNWPTHKVTFMNGNTIVSEQEVYEGENASAPSLKQDGYELSWNGEYTNVVSDVTVYAVWTKKESVSDTSTDKKTDFEKDSAEADDSTNSTVQKIPNEDTDASYEVPKPKKVTSLSVKNIKTKKLSISWKKQNSVDGYQIQIATKKNFKTGKKTKTAYSNKLTWTGLKKGKTYYVRVRGYNYDENDCKQYGAWSTVKSVKVRK